MNKYHFWHKSIKSGKTYTPDKFLYTDPETNELLMVERDEAYITQTLGSGKQLCEHFDALRYGPERRTYPNNSGVWLWRDFILPGFPEEAIISLNEGQTDLFEIPDWLKKQIGLNKLFIKMEGQSPSESFKDRGMPVAVSDALRLQMQNPALGITGVACASTGDTSAAAAIYSAYRKDKLACTVLLPYEHIADSQLFQAMAHGANVIAVKHPDGFDGCMKLIQEFTAHHPEHVLVNSKNDMRLVGQETIGLEILQDLEWQVPDWIVIPVGNGGNLSALMVGLLRAKEHGMIDRLPGIIGAQASAADTLSRWESSDFTKYEPGLFKETVASAMNINAPVSFPRIESLYKKFHIHFMSVEEKDIKDTWARFMQAGANICPQSAVALHAAITARANGLIKEDDTVVSISTASGIKFSQAGINYHKGNEGKFKNSYKIAEGNLEAIEKLL
ncbi:MAG: threonine synthase [Candidatus Pacebacteria bacterium]|nr:threonine synthase [Candidatus Paceibacterota bacterium]